MSRNKEQANGRKTTVMSRVKADSENQEVIDGYDYLGNSSSATDCTGLIPSAPKKPGRTGFLRRNLSLPAQAVREE